MMRKLDGNTADRTLAYLVTQETWLAYFQIDPHLNGDLNMDGSDHHGLYSPMELSQHQTYSVTVRHEHTGLTVSLCHKTTP